MKDQNPVFLKRTAGKRYKYLGAKGKVLTFTMVTTGPEDLFNRTPYWVAVVDFGEKRATVPLIEIDPEKIKKGMRVVGVLRRMMEPTKEGVITYGVKCRLVGS